MENKKFLEKAVEEVIDDFNRNYASQDKATKENTDIVWYAKELQNHKAMVIVRAHNSRYYEITYNGDQGEFYLDAYKKERNVLIALGGEEDED